jgi:HSP20 family protein
VIHTEQTREKENTMTRWLPESWRHTAERLRDDLHRVIDRCWHRHEQTDAPRELEVVDETRPSLRPWTSFVGTPALDIEENDDEIIVTADLPGLERDDYTVEVSGTRLIIHGEKKHASERRGDGYYYAERSYGAFTRTLPLPCGVEAEKAVARYKNGVLRVTLPKTAQARATRVHVKVS